MALIKCSECDHDVSDQAPSCPNCGYVFKKELGSQDISINQAPDINIEKIVKTGKTWKVLKLISWIGGIIGFLMAFSNKEDSFANIFGWSLLVTCIILFIVSKFGNWWERG